MGIIWPHSNTIARNNSDARAPGAKAYFYEAGTTTPRAAYQDAALTTPHANPVLADGNGRFPAVFLDYGAYRERVQTAGGTTLWDTDAIPNPAPIDPDTDVDPDAILRTGDIIISLRQGSRDGFVRCNGSSIGNTASSATQRANPDAEALFLYIYNSFSDTACPVSGGRTGNAQNDWNSNKNIGTPDLRGANLVGLADMGSGDNGALNAVTFIYGDKITGASLLGANTHTLTTAQLPTFTPASTINAFTPAGSISPSPYLPAGTISAYTPSGSISISDTRAWRTAGNIVGSAGGAKAATGGGSSWGENHQSDVAVTGGTISGSFSGAAASLSFTGSAQSFAFTGAPVTLSGSSIGSGAPHSIMQRGITCTYLMKL